jgi:hypothetical protein
MKKKIDVQLAEILVDTLECLGRVIASAQTPEEEKRASTTAKKISKTLEEIVNRKLYCHVKDEVLFIEEAGTHSVLLVRRLFPSSLEITDDDSGEEAPVIGCPVIDKPIKEEKETLPFKHVLWND